MPSRGELAQMEWENVGALACVHNVYIPKIVLP